MDEKDTYQPIQCQLYDYVEIACLHGLNLDLELTSNKTITGKALTTRIKDKQEFIVIETKDGDHEIRLDTVKSITALNKNAEFSTVIIN